MINMKAFVSLFVGMIVVFLAVSYINMASGCSSSVSFFDHTVFITNIQHRKLKKKKKIAVLQLGFFPFKCQDSHDAVFQGFAFKIKNKNVMPALQSFEPHGPPEQLFPTLWVISFSSRTNLRY